MTEEVPQLPGGQKAAVEPSGGAFGVVSGSEMARQYNVDRTQGTPGKCSACGFESLAVIEGRCSLCRVVDAAGE